MRNIKPHDGEQEKAKIKRSTIIIITVFYLVVLGLVMPGVYRQYTSASWPSVEGTVVTTDVFKKSGGSGSAATGVALSADEVADLDALAARTGVHGNRYNDRGMAMIGR